MYLFSNMAILGIMLNFRVRSQEFFSWEMYQKWYNYPCIRKNVLFLLITRMAIDDGLKNAKKVGDISPQAGFKLGVNVSKTRWPTPVLANHKGSSPQKNMLGLDRFDLIDCSSKLYTYSQFPVKIKSRC